MKFLAGWLCMVLAVSGVLNGAEPEPPPVVTAVEEDVYLPGVALSQGITEITGVAISPLLGVSAVGAWQYWKCPDEARTELPWYSQPWAWGTGFAVLALCFLKDLLGAAVPGVLKKPFDMVELFEDKVSAAVASAAFVPLVANQMAVHFRAGHPDGIAVPGGSLIGIGFASIDVLWLMVPLAVAAFLVVWVCSHAINVLIILSPFSTVDSILKLMRASLLASLALVYVIAPWLAAALCLVIIAVAAWLAPAALRLAIFGARFAADILLPGRGRNRATPESPHAFTLGRMGGLPPRTGGRLLMLDDGTAVFRYRRCCVLDERTIPLPDGIRHIERGVFSPSLIHRGDIRETKLLLFLPRYRGHEQRMMDHWRFHGVRDHAVARGFSAVRDWLAEILRRPKPSVPGG